jgi:uncharacterized protein (TIGR02147 family)
MSLSVFDFDDYRAYLVAQIDSRPSKGRGFRSQLAEQIGCQRAFITQVLRGDVHFNLEHGEAVANVLGLTQEETEFFVLLILYARAGTKRLRDLFLSQIKKVREKRASIKSRFNMNDALSAEDKSTYYSSWQYGAIRVLLTIPEFQSRSKIEARLKISPGRLSKLLEFLTSRGLVVEKDGKLQTTEKHMFIGDDFGLVVKHNVNWRMRAVQALEEEKKQNLHFSSVNSLSRKDAEELQKRMRDFIEEVAKKIQPSPEEVLYSFCVDFFEV